MSSEVQTVTVPHLGSSTIGYKFGKPYDALLPTLVLVNSFTEEVVQDVELDGVPSPSVPSLSVRRRSAPPNDANQCAVKAQFSSIVAGPPAGTNSSSCTSAERALLALQCQQQGRQYEAIYHDRNMIACSAR